MEHRHKDLIIKWANNKDIKIEASRCGSDDWCEVSRPEWYEEQEYREVDPLKEFKDAHASGKIIEILAHYGEWEILHNPNWNNDIKRYRIKPELEYIPFDWEDRDLLRGRWITTKDEVGQKEYLINKFFLPQGGSPQCREGSFEYIFDNYTFLDGTPCGKLKA